MKFISALGFKDSMHFTQHVPLLSHSKCTYFLKSQEENTLKLLLRSGVLGVEIFSGITRFKTVAN